MKEVSCEVIRDLLPLYEDGAASEESQALVREHLKDCPACRDELGKLRAPVSLPPEPEEDAFWTRFREGQAQHRRAVRRRILCAAVVLAALIGAALWYTRPMTLGELCPGLDQGKVTSLSSSCKVQETHSDGKVDTLFHSVNLYGEEAGEAIEELLQILNAQTYRRSLTSLLPRPQAYTSTEKSPFQWQFGLGGGLHLSMDSFFPHKLDLSYDYGENKTQVYCAVADQEAFYREVYLFLEKLVVESDSKVLSQ